MTFTYGAVDEGVDPQEAVDWQERVNSWAGIRAYKERTYELLAGAERILDVGCGPGTDVVELGGGRAIGLDPSAVMCRRAAGRGVTACRGEMPTLPFPDGTFDGCRADRVLQHVAQPRTALQELVRVTRPGGRVVVADPDQESLTLHVPEVPTELVDRVKRLRRDVGYRNGRLVSQLPHVLGGLGLVEVEITAHPLVLTDPDDAFGLPSWPHHWRDSPVGPWTDAELAAWDEGIAAGRNGGFVFALLYFVVAARRPAGMT